MAIWVNLNRAAKFPEVVRVYKRAGRGQGTGQGVGAGGANGPSTPASAPAGFLQTVKNFVTSGAALPAWIRKMPGGSNDWQNVQVDVTAIPGVRALRTNGKAQVFVA
jgi:hypothetical protein